MRRKRPDHRRHRWAWWTMTCPRRTPGMGPRSGQPGTLAARLQSPGRRRRKPPREAPPTGRRRLLQDLRLTRSSAWSSTRSSAWAAAGSLARARAAAPEAAGAPKTQQRAAASWNGPWPSTNGVCSRSWAWPGRRPGLSGADVALRSWSYCLTSDRRRVQRRTVMRARTRARKSRPASDGAWSSPLHRKSAGWHGSGGTWKARPRPYCPRLCEPGPWHCWGSWRMVAISAGGPTPWNWLSMA